MSDIWRAWYLWQCIGWLGIAAVVVLSLIPMPGPALPMDHSDKLLHVVTYGVLAFWFGQLHRGGWRWVFVGLLALGAGLELAQGWLVLRNADGWDLMADALGIALGLWLAATRVGGLLRWLDSRVPQASR